jgi:protease-4
MYDQFVGAVALGRKMNVQTVRHLADGRVYTGQEAKANGLIDEIGTFQDALSAATKMVGISGEPRLLSPPKRKLSLIDLLFGDSRSIVALNPDPSESQIRFAYLWR